MNRRSFFVSASRYSMAGLLAAEGGLLFASEAKPHGENVADKGHGKPPAKGHGAETKGPAAEAAKVHANPAAPPAAPKQAPKPPASTAIVKPKPAKPAARANAGRGAEENRNGRPITAAEAYDELKAGNKRFAANRPRHPHLTNLRARLTGREGQPPHAVVLMCADSRVPAETVFDQGTGDIFTVRVVGNVANMDEIASVEYGVQHLQAPLVVVMGHTECGAVKAVVDGSHLPDEIAQLVRSIRTAFTRTRASAPTLTGKQLVNAVAQMNVWESIEDMLKGGSIMRDKLRSNEVRIVGATYHIDTGEVTWMGAHPNQCDYI